MTLLDYLLLAGVVLAAGYVVARLFTGWLRSSSDNRGVECSDEPEAPIVPQRLEKTEAPWHYRK